MKPFSLHTLFAVICTLFPCTALGAVFEKVYVEEGAIRQSSGRSPAQIVYAIDNEGELYVNGHEVSKVDDWHQVKGVSVDLADGDTISVKATDTGLWYGVIVDIYYKGQHFGTGNSEWKAVREFTLRGRENQDAWMFSNYSTCKWPSAELRDSDGNMISGKAPGFPYEKTNASYVWAGNAGEHDEVFLRFKLGGEICEPEQAHVTGTGMQKTKAMKDALAVCFALVSNR